MKVFHLFVLTWPSYQVRLLEVSAVDVNELKALTWNLFSVGPIKVNLALVLHVISDKMICLTLLQGVIIVLYLKIGHLELYVRTQNIKYKIHTTSTVGWLAEYFSQTKPRI